MFDIQHMIDEGCSSGSCSYNGKEPMNNEACKKEGCKRESSVFGPMFQALDEFKSDVDLYYKQRRAAEHQSGMHDKRGVMNYKSRADKTRDYGSGANMGYRNSSDEIPRNAEDKKYIDADNRGSARNTDSTISTRKNAREYNKQHPEEAKKSAQEMRKAKHESASIFDDLFDQI